jgi:hypothetical protein
VNKRTQKKRTVQKRPVRKTSKPRKKKNTGGFKNSLNLLIIWSLVVLNGVLIFSLLHKIINMGTPNRQHDVIIPGRNTEPLEDPVTVTVHNGCGVQGLAGRFQAILTQYKYDVRDVGNSSDPYDKTVIIDRGTKSKQDIEKLRELMGLKKDRVIKIDRAGYKTDVKIILGKDYSNLSIYKNNQ